MATVVPQILNATTKQSESSEASYNGTGQDQLKVLNQAELAALSSYICVVGILGLIGNILVIAAFYRYRSLRTSTNTFILHLALCNLILAAMDLGFALPSTASRRWLFGLNACRFYGITYHFFCFVSLNTLAIISLDRYWVITKPAIGIKITIRRAVLCIAISYVYTIVFSTPLFLQWNSFEEEVFYTGCYLSFSELTIASLTYSIIHGLFLFLVPFTIMIFCYGSIFKSVKRKGRYGVRLRSMKKNNKLSFTIQRIPHWRTARMIIVVIFVFLACWLPYVIVSTAMSLGRQPQITALTLEVTLLVAKSGVIYNPFIYAALNLRFRTAFFEMLKCERFIDPAKLGIKGRILTVTGDSSGQHVSRTSASNCTSSRALVTRSASYIRAQCDACSADNGSHPCAKHTGNPSQRPHSAPDAQWQQIDLKCGDDELVLVRNDSGKTRNLTVSTTKPNSLEINSSSSERGSNSKNGTQKSPELESFSDSEKSDNNLVQILRISTKDADTPLDSNSACPCREIWKGRPTAKVKKKRYSANPKDENAFLCTCGPNVKLIGTPQPFTRKDHGKNSKSALHNGSSARVLNGTNPSEDFQICQTCMKQVLKEEPKKNGTRDAKGKRFSYHFTGRLNGHRQSLDSSYCSCHKEAHRFWIKDSNFKRKLKNRRTSESVQSACSVNGNDSFWRRPSLVLANNIHPVRLSPTVDLKWS